VNDPESRVWLKFKFNLARFIWRILPLEAVSRGKHFHVFVLFLIMYLFYLPDHLDQNVGLESESDLWISNRSSAFKTWTVPCEYRSPIRIFVNNWFLSRRAYNFPGRSTQDYSLEQADDCKHLSSIDELETMLTLKFSFQKEQNCYSSLSTQARSWIRSLFPHSNEQGFLPLK